MREVVEQELGGEVVAAVDDEVTTCKQPGGIARIEPQPVRFDLHLGVECADPRRGEICFGLAAIREREPGLAVQVGGFEAIAIDDHQPPDSSTCEVLQHGYA